MAPSSPVAVESVDRWYLRSVVDGGRNENMLRREEIKIKCREH